MLITSKSTYDSVIRKRENVRRPDLINLQEFTQLNGEPIWLLYTHELEEAVYTSYETVNGPTFFFRSENGYELQRVAANLDKLPLKQLLKTSAIHSLPRLTYVREGGFISYPKQERVTKPIYHLVTEIIRPGEKIPSPIAGNLFFSVAPFFYVAEHLGLSMNDIRVSEFRVAQEEGEFLPSFTPVPVFMGPAEEQREFENIHLLPAFSKQGLTVDQITHLRVFRTLLNKVSTSAEDSIFRLSPEVAELLLGGLPNNMTIREYLEKIHILLRRINPNLFL